MVDPILLISIFVAIIAHIAIHLWLSRKPVTSPIISKNPLESSVKVTETAKEESKNETVPSKPLITFSSMPVVKPVLKTDQTDNEQAKNAQMVATTTESIVSSSFTVPKSLTSPNKTIVSLGTVNSTTVSSTRLGGFAFSATQTTSQSNSNETNSISKSETTQTGSLFTSSAPMFSFGTSKPSSDSSDLAKPTFSFGSTKVDEPPKSMPTLSNSSLSSSVPVVDSNNTFSFGISIRKTVQPELNKVSFTLPTTNNMSTAVQSAPVTSASVGFSFGSPVSKNANTSSNTLPTNTGSSVFAFGGNTSSTQQAASSFGSVKSSSIPLPTFGSVTNANNSTPQFGINSQSTFGGNQVTTATTSASIFGNNNTLASTNTGGNLFQFGNRVKTSVFTGQSSTSGMSSNPCTTGESTTNTFGSTGWSGTRNPNTFQFTAGPQQQQRASTNLFSIGSSLPTTTKTGRPMRTAIRRIK